MHFHVCTCECSNIINTDSHGKGCMLYDVDGGEYLDMAAGIATCCLGTCITCFCEYIGICIHSYVNTCLHTTTYVHTTPGHSNDALKKAGNTLTQRNTSHN